MGTCTPPDKFLMGAQSSTMFWFLKNLGFRVFSGLRLRHFLAGGLRSRLGQVPHLVLSTHFHPIPLGSHADLGIMTSPPPACLVPSTCHQQSSSCFWNLKSRSRQGHMFFGRSSGCIAGGCTDGSGQYSVGSRSAGPHSPLEMVTSEIHPRSAVYHSCI